MCLWQDWAKPGPYDQPMVNTLRRKKDKDAPAVLDSNGGVGSDGGPASVPASLPAPAALQTSASVEEKSRSVAAPLKVRAALRQRVSPTLTQAVWPPARHSSVCVV